MNYALLLLAGSATRFKSSVPKQFYLLDKKPLFFYPLNALNESKNIDYIVLVVPENKVTAIKDFVKKHKIKKVLCIIAGGNTRNKSVKNGLEAIKKKAKDSDIILIHDAARPLLDQEIIANAIKETKKKKATTFALRCFDTMVKANNKCEVQEYINREEVFALQTPQTFIYKIIKNAYQKVQKSNDDTELVHHLKHTVYLLEGYEKLFKITSKEDIQKLTSYLKCAIK